MFSDLSAAVRARVAYAKAFVFDMDGTLILGNALSEGFSALPGAIELIASLRRRRIPFRVFTNGTAKTPEHYAASLRSVDIDIEDSEMMTPSTAAAIWFMHRGIRRIRVLGLDGVQGPLRQAGLDVVGPSESADGIEAVFTGQFREFTFPDLEAAYRDIAAGALFTSASNVPFFATKGGRGIGISFAMNTMLAAITGKRVCVLGKPSRAALVSALHLMGLRAGALKETIVVGDDPVLEIGMARKAGATAIAVTSGLSERQLFETAPTTLKPDAVLANLMPLVEVYA